MTKIPEGFATVTPTLVLNDAAKAIDTYVKAFGAKETYRMACPQSGKIMHACIQIGSSKVFLCDTNPEKGCAEATSGSFYLYMDDADAAFKKAKDAGLQSVSEPQDQFWGDRTGNLKDSFGNSWTVATHTRDVSQQEIQDAVKKMAKAA